jgi:hypothetical protein
MIRSAEEDLFGLGSREAVVRAAYGDAADRPLFGPPLSSAELCGALTPLGVTFTAQGDGALTVRHVADAFGRGRIAAQIEVLCFSAGWSVDTHDNAATGTVTVIASLSS